MSKCWVGKSHDFCILKEEFPPQKLWFKNHEVQLDLGFMGFEKKYEREYVRIPHKKSKGKELDEQQKIENKKISSERIKVEHSIGGMKRFRFCQTGPECMILIYMMTYWESSPAYGISI